MEKENFDHLLDKYLSGISSPREDRLLMEYYRRLEQLPGSSLSEKKAAELKKLMQSGIDQAIFEDKKVRPIRRWWPAVAAAIILVFMISGIWLLNRQSVAVKLTVATGYPPGGDRATLFLADGQQIVLSDVQNGTLATEGTTTITKRADGQLVYNHARQKTAQHSTAINKIVTPRGGQYQLILSDGTGVWLNAASSISYPVAFSADTREVSITGEVYFEVVHNASRPFKVHAGGQLIEDIGTTFDVNAYPDEPDTRVTLLEGSVKMGGVLLHPGQQAVEKDGKITLREVDGEKITGWKDGFFLFHDTPLPVIMRQLSRWYDLDVVYKGQVPDLRFGGGIQRTSDLKSVLAVLERGGIHFTIKDKKIIVTP